MLDLYLHTDGAPCSSDPDECNHLTGFSFEEFCELERWQVIPDQLSFHDDCILKSGIVEAMLQNTSAKSEMLKQTPGFQSACLERLEQALQTAQRDGRGLLFICD